MRKYAASFAEAMEAVGLATTDPIHSDGVIHRFYVQGDRKGTLNGWYVLQPESLGFGAFGSWRTGSEHGWCYRSVGERKASYASLKPLPSSLGNGAGDGNKARMLVIWQTAKDANPYHPYLVRKNVDAHGIRQSGRQLVIPMCSGIGRVEGLQFINDDGDKRNMKGSKTTGLYFRINGDLATFVIAEGFATAATLYEASGHTSVVAFGAKNLASVALGIRRANTTSRILIACDHDPMGIAAAEHAAEVVDGYVIRLREKEGV